MKINSWNILTFVLVLFISSVLFVGLYTMLGIHVTFIAQADDDYLGAIEFWSSEYYPYPGLGLGYPNLTGMGWRQPSQLEMAVRTAGGGDITALTKYIQKIGISSYGQPGSTDIVYPNMAGIATTPGVLDYSAVNPYSFNWSQASWNSYPQDTGWLTGGTVYGAGFYGKPITTWQEFTSFSMKYGHYKILPSEFDFPEKKKYGGLYGGLYGLGSYGIGGIISDPWF